MRQMIPKKMVRALLAWFSSNARDLPWRRTRDPYGIWVSEVMLQQTQVKTVVGYWERWMQSLPTIASLARAKPGRVHKLWEGLGYYTRVRNMQLAARQIMREHSGRFPEEFEEVLKLPGIGRYTAGAICSIAFNQAKPILDGNVIRVLSRLFGIEGNPREKIINDRLWRLAEELVLSAASIGESGQTGRRRSEVSAENGTGNGHAGENNGKRRDRPVRACSQLNQALMELGALVCTPQRPQCGICPVAEGCEALHRGQVDELPNLSPRPRVTPRRFVAFVSEEGGRFFVRQRPPGVVNAHLWEFPNAEIPQGRTNLEDTARKVLGAMPAALEPLCTLRHSITRYRITLEVFLATRGGTRIVSKVGWLQRSQLARLPFCSAHKKILGKLGIGNRRTRRI
jgi:A/G-specific adenine glycosylase